MNVVTVKILNKSRYANPEYQTTGAACADLYNNEPEPIALGPLERHLFSTGIYVALPDSFELQIRPRSGLAAKQGVTVLNTPGTIDEDYLGEVKVCLVNLSNHGVVIKPGDRIAQMAVKPVYTIAWHELDDEQFINMETKRGTGGFGSTGK